MTAIPCNTDECCKFPAAFDSLTAIGSLMALLKEVCDFVAIDKYDDDYIHYELTNDMYDPYGCITRHFPGDRDEGGEEDVWWIGLSNLNSNAFDFSKKREDEMKKQVLEVVELIRNSPNYANFMRLAQSA